MATEYSLLTCLGRDGQTVTLTIASPCVVTLSAHGMPDGHPIRFTTTGTLPTGLAINTTYYVKSPTANVFNVSATNGGAAINTSGSQSGTHKAIGEYWATLPATDPGNGGNYRARYGTAGSERVYNGLYALETYLLANSDPSLEVVVEVQGKWVDTKAYRPPGAYSGFYSICIWSKINGVRDNDSFHSGVIGGGWQCVGNSNNYAPIQIQKQPNMIIDGLEIVNLGTTGSHAVRAYYNTKGYISNCLLKGYIGLEMNTTGYSVYNTITYNCASIGINFPTGFGIGDVVNNCMATGCATGFSGGSTYAGAVINCCSFNNTTNWGAQPTSTAFLALNNAGISTDTPWDTGTTSLTSLVSGDFDSNYKPAAASAHQVNTGVAFTGLTPLDMLGAVRPNYESASYPNNLWDIGPFEYDHGEGLAPQSVTVSITGMASGSEIAIYKASDMSQILAPQSTAGSYSGTYTYTGDVNIIVRVRKGTSATRYLPYEYAGTITSTGFQLVVSQIPDTIAQ